MSKILNELKQYCGDNLNDTHLGIVYGSYAYGTAKDNSDIDIMVLDEEFSLEQINNLVDFIFKIHNKYGLELDFEVPYDKKLLVNKKILIQGIEGKCFEKEENRLIIPPIIPTQEFLSSDVLLMRLALNAFTNKNLFFSGNEQEYMAYKDRAVESLVAFIFALNPAESYNISQFIEKMHSDSQQKDKLYLGYKNKPEIVEYFTEMLERKFNTLCADGVLSRNANKYSILNFKWLYDKISKVPHKSMTNPS
ncbi:hypothetical protein GF358_00605 [Candidatus Woesearchaeota archaeon]|nr:hypothetical protein [Candidatus Woesearchaeota archaeon]